MLDDKPTFPIQDLADEWWIEDGNPTLCRGRLISAFLPHTDPIPYELIPESRPASAPTDHNSAVITTRPLRYSQVRSLAKIPVAALPDYEKERYIAQRAKARPAIIICCGGTDVAKKLSGGKHARWMTNSTFLVAPCYGTGKTGSRAGWNPELLRRIYCCEYPQYMLDSLPISQGTSSVIRFDHIQPISRHHESFKPYPFRLSIEALDIIDEWLEWLMAGELCEDGYLEEYRAEALGLIGRGN